MKKKSIFGCLAIICLLLVLIPPVLTRAEKHSLITWEKKSKNVVSMYLELQEKEAFEEIKAFSLTLNFDSKEDLSEEPVFKFGSDFKGEKVSVHEERYNEEDQTMKLYVAGRDTVLEKGEKVLLGTITIKSDENVTISVDENDFQIVDRFHEKGMITEFGDFEPYEMILKKEEETTVPETTVPETTVPETTDPETMIPPCRRPLWTRTSTVSAATSRPLLRSARRSQQRLWKRASPRSFSTVAVTFIMAVLRPWLMAPVRAA